MKVMKSASCKRSAAVEANGSGTKFRRTHMQKRISCTLLAYVKAPVSAGPYCEFTKGFILRGVMQQYEIHIGQDNLQHRTYPCLQLNDHAAVRRAQSLAKKSESVEVWRAEVCVYARRAEQSHGKI